MTSSSNKPGVAFWATVVVIVALIPSAAYLGAYACLVEPDKRLVYSLGTDSSIVVETYPSIGKSQFWRSFFEPANWLDRRIRPDVWNR
jgi:hypothetical protein